MRTLHYIQHVPYEHPGMVKDWASERSVPTRETLLFAGDALPSLEKGDLLLVMGGPMGVGDDADYPWMVAEKAFIKDAIENRVPTLGICLGAQLIAHVLGAEVLANPYTEIGFFSVTLTKAAAREPLFEQIPRVFTPFHWHGDTFMIPDDALRIAGNDACMNQGFLGPGKVMGVQFHLEAGTRLIEEWSTHFFSEPHPPYVQAKQDISRSANSFAEKNRTILYTLLDRFYLSSV